MKPKLRLPNSLLSTFTKLLLNFQIHKPKLDLQTSKILGLLVGVGFFSIVGPALAHHATGGNTPTNFWTGFVSGLAHPIIGLDHLAFVVAIGLIAANRVRGALIPGAFGLTAMVGTGVHLLRIDLPVTEIVIAISVIALGAMLVTGKRPSSPVLMGLAAIAGLFHGYAYGEAIVGAEMTPLFAYLAGFTLIQFAIARIALAIGNTVLQRPTSHSLVRFCGYGICSIGISFLTVSILG